jgi:hypothetical protein
MITIPLSIKNEKTPFDLRNMDGSAVVRLMLISDVVRLLPRDPVGDVECRFRIKKKPEQDSPGDQTATVCS